MLSITICHIRCNMQHLEKNMSNIAISENSLNIKIPFSEFVKISDFFEIRYLRIKIYNNIDYTCYEICYSKKSEIFESDITCRILSDVVRESKTNISRSHGLNFDNIRYEASGDYSEVHVLDKLINKKHRCYLHKCCTVGISLD